MSLFSSFVKPYRKGEKNFERARAAEVRKQYDKAEAYFTDAAQAFDAHFAAKQEQGSKLSTSHLVMAGISYNRIGRHEDALRVLDQALGRKEIPDALVNAGYAAAKLGQPERATRYWSSYPDWAGQRYIATALKEVVDNLSQDKPDLDRACLIVAEAVARQDNFNEKDRRTRESGNKQTSEFRQGY